MKIYVSHSLQFDFANDLYKPLRNSPLNNSFDFFLPHEDYLNINSKEQIRASDCVLAEVSFSSIGQGIELGWAEMLNVPIVCIYKEGKNVTKALSYITDKVVSYSDTDDMLSKISTMLVK